MKKNSLQIILIISLVFAGFILWKITRREAPSQRSFTIAKAWWPVWDTFQIGVNQREKDERSFETKFLQKSDYTPSLNDFVEKKAEAATLTIFEALLAVSRGIPIKIVLLLDYTTGSDGVIAKKNISSVLDLKGKRIGIERGTIAHFTLLKALEKAGLNSSEVQLMNYNLEELQQAFLHDKVDAMGTYEPYMSNLASQGNGHIIFSSREIPRSICDVLFVREDIAREHPDFIDHWLLAWNDVLSFKESHAEEYLNALNRLNGTPISDISESFKGIFFTNVAENRSAFGTKDKPGYLLDSLREMEQFMLTEGIIKQKNSLENLLEFDAIHRVFKE